jgi:tRNA pseudouridine38-40 synthase
MARFRCDIEYEGTRYRGWQIQKNARTVQGEITAVLRELFPSVPLEFQGSGRTDAGVHALGQVAHLDVATVLAPEIICRKANDLLPADINILRIRKVPPTFHARHHAIARSYLYQIARRRTALGKRWVWWVKDDLDVAAMRTAAKEFEGMHDFVSFTEEDPDDASTKVLLDSVELKDAGDLFLVRIIGSHFIWKMIRRIVGVLVETGRGNMTADDIHRLLRSSSDEPARLTAPPSGLFLERVYYKGENRSTQLRPVLNLTHD